MSVFERIFFESSVPIAQVAPDGSFLIVNDAFCQLTGYCAQELLAGGFQQITHPDDLSLDLDHVRNLLAGSAARYSMEKRYIRKDGSITWVNLTATLARDAQGRPDFFISVAEMIDERKRAEAELAESEARMRTIVETVPVGIVFAELPSGRIVSGNKQVENILGHPVLFSPDRDSYDEWVSYHADGSRVKGHEYPLARIARGEEFPSLEVNYQRGDGTLSWVRFIARAVKDGAGNFVGGVVASLDIDPERKAWERVTREVESLQDQLIHTSRVNAMNTMAGMLAHELNQPLTAAANYLGGTKRLLTQDPPAIAEALKGVNETQDAVLRAGLIITSIRQMVSGKSGTKVNVKVKDLVEDSIRLLGSSMKIAPMVEIGASADEIWVDQVQIEQVLLNLARNANEAIQGQESPFIRIAAVSDGEFVEMSVSDNGTGIPDEMRDVLFSPFKSATGTGLGIGLSVCRTIVEQHGGRIWLDETDDFTTFKFSLPKSQDVGAPMVETPA